MNMDLNFALMIPEFIVIGGAILVLLLDAMTHSDDGRGDPRGATASLSVAACVGAILWICSNLSGTTEASFGGLFEVDAFANYFKVVILLGTALSLLLSDSWLKDRGLSSGASHAMVLFATVGMMYMVSAGDLVMLFLGLEVMSIPIYCLAASWRWDDRSVEAGVKYLVLGSFATALMLFGMALLYAFQGFEGGEATTHLGTIRETLASWDGSSSAHYALGGGLLVLVGLLFKISAAPFHMWTPDVYEGAPTAITAYMSVAVKATAAAVLLRLFGGAVLSGLGLEMLLWVVAALTMILGNVMALAQTNVKRILAYSSIAHGGYILVGILATAGSDAEVALAAQSAVLYYALAYTVGNIAAFGVLVYLSRQGFEADTLDDLKGLGSRFPWVGGVMAIAMLSLIGIPPFAGFFAKFAIFKAAVSQGYVLLTVLALLTSAVSVAYYLRPLIVMFMETSDQEPAPEPRMRPRLVLAILVATGLVVGLGFVPEATMEWVASVPAEFALK